MEIYNITDQPFWNKVQQIVFSVKKNKNNIVFSNVRDIMCPEKPSFILCVVTVKSGSKDEIKLSTTF